MKQNSLSGSRMPKRTTLSEEELRRLIEDDNDEDLSSDSDGDPKDKDWVPDKDGSSSDSDGETPNQESFIEVDISAPDPTFPEATATELDVVDDQASVERRNTEQHPKRKKETYIDRKKKRAAGQEYTAQKTQKVVPAKELKEFSCKCKLECKTIDQDARKAIFESFWLLGKELGSMESQRQFVSKCVTKKPVGRRTTSASSSRRQNSLCYTLELNSTCKKVCKKFFLATLGLGEKFVAGCVKSKTNTGTAGRDRRNVSSPKNLVSKRLTDDQLLYARDQISSFPAVESHYCRANSTRLYLSSELNQPKMYKLYTETCLSSRRVPVCNSIYRKIFKSLNLSFHTPRKDQCHTCTQYYLITEGEKENEAESFQQHQSRAKCAREVKNAIKDGILHSEEGLESAMLLNMDLQRVLETPKAETSPIFYKRKLAVYNMTNF